jgi:uncharacterized RDD family membrane protein YckC
MRCPQCGCDNPETVPRCRGCGLTWMPGSGSAAAWGPLGPEGFSLQIAGLQFPLEALAYATMGERFLAFLCDASIETLLVGAFLTVSYLKSSLDFDSLEQLALWIIPIAYMTLAEFVFHGTVGKRLLRIQLLADSPECKYPTLFQILLRESVGKFLCGLTFGIGFLVAIGNSKKKTWADRMARTVVVRTGVVSAPFKAFLVIVLICTYVGFAIALKEIPATYRKNLADQLQTEERRVDDLHEQILLSFFNAEPKSVRDYQQVMTRLSSTLDEYDRLLEREQELISRSSKLLTRRESYESYRLEIYGKVIPLRQEIAVLLRKHMQLVLAFDSQRQSWEQILQDRLQTRGEIFGRNYRVNQIGQSAIPKKLEF